MKKIKLKSIIAMLLVALISSGISVAAVSITAKDIGFTSSDEGWEVTNVEDAMNDLYKYKDSSGVKLLWTNSDVSQTFAAQTISLDLSDYDAIMIDLVYHYQYPTDYRTMQVFPKDGKSYYLLNGFYGIDAYSRMITVNNDNIVFTTGGSGDVGTYPHKIYGVKWISSYPEMEN